MFRQTLKLSFRRCLQKNNSFLAIVFGELFKKFAVIILTETHGNDCWKFSIKAKSRKFWKISKINVGVTKANFRKNDSKKNCKN
ncbi:hypothetical protein FQU78_07675 [Methanosarcina mazei]|uniref:Uncharacterized protein n=1 Tax=Methanosarcina mazei TaxID=2209 RepID=A0A6C0VHK6_METMZ|nr:hypothetical protein FQU78_07675 [Methanosarcina mazei]